MALQNDFRRLWVGVASALLVLALAPATSPALAAAGGVARFAPGQLRSIAQLPPGQLQRRIQSLSPQAQANALHWLQKISLTGADYDQLRVDIGGGVFVADNQSVPAASTRGKGSVSANAVSGPVSAAWVPADAFKLHSRPGATNRVYLDFDGHTFTNTAWGAGTFVALAFSQDADRSTFSDTERGAIIDIWHRVAEDLAPFNIDVTTEEPTTFTNTTGRVIVTEHTDANGVAMPAPGSGGVAYVNVFGASNYASYYSPAIVYADSLGPNVQTYIAEASSHEFGHNLGLSHDGTAVGGAAYYGGQGSGLVSWAPIMGNGYYNNVTEWSKGEYADANQTQDDLAIIATKLGYRPDDHGDTIGSGTALVVNADGTVDSSNPELDPYNLLPQNKGVIGSATDVDVFSFTAGAGPLTLTVKPAWEAFYRGTTRRGANLDVGLELRDNAGGLIASNDPDTDTMATVSATVGAGTYHLLVTGVANAVTPYSTYGSVGEYFINGSITTGAVIDTTAPTPDPMSFASAPAATGTSSIAMTASTATDAVSSVQYRFNCVAGGTGCVSSAWQSGTSYSATGLAAASPYSFTVQARDLAGNTTAASAVASASTDSLPPPPPYVDYAAASDTAVAGTVSGGVGNTAADDGVLQSITEVDSGGKPSSRYSTLERRWNFNVSAGIATTVIANAWSSGSSDGDAFAFEVSTNGGSSWSALFTVASTSSGNVQSAVLPGAPSGAIMVRVIDTNHTAGARAYDTVFVDQLIVQVTNPSNDPPLGNPSGLTASALSSSQINLAWIDGVSGESGYRVERSPNGSSGWSIIATLGLNSQAYSDTGLAASTTYFYRVSAFNVNGSTGFTSASATTPVAPPPPSLSLTAVGYKVKAVSKVDLSWTGASGNVDVYRNGSKVGSNIGGTAYTDNINSKGAGTYTHKVCAAGSTSSCSNTTTTVF